MRRFARSFSCWFRRCTDEWCSPKCVVGHGTPAEGILEIARWVDADLIVLGPRKPSFTLTHLEQGVTVQVLCQTECPVLTVA
jgi:nucleotide-binding universal stress UspA family protein